MLYNTITHTYRLFHNLKISKRTHHHPTIPSPPSWHPTLLKSTFHTLINTYITLLFGTFFGLGHPKHQSPCLSYLHSRRSTTFLVPTTSLGKICCRGTLPERHVCVVTGGLLVRLTSCLPRLCCRSSMLSLWMHSERLKMDWCVTNLF